MRVFLTGGTGLIGRRIVSQLRDRGDEVIVLSRSADAATRVPASTGVVIGDPAIAGPWLDELATCDGTIHLAGEPIVGGRWTAEFKQKVLDSRVNSTRLIAETLAKSPTKADGSPRVLVSASAIGYYGVYEDNPTEFVEADRRGPGSWPMSARPGRRNRTFRQRGRTRRDRSRRGCARPGRRRHCRKSPSRSAGSSAARWPVAGSG